jgi:EPS-associated MarR family transcriptional regulator
MIMHESEFKALRELAKDGSLSQRDLAVRMGVSLGKVNYLVGALLEKGFIKARRFKNSKNKIAYMYILTPQGLSVRVAQTQAFLERKTAEYESLRDEVEALRSEHIG